jgi:hypothetical protein
MNQKFLILLIGSFTSAGLLLSISSTTPFFKKVFAQSPPANVQNGTAAGSGLKAIENATTSVLKTDLGKLKQLLSTPFTIITGISEIPGIQVSGVNFGDTDISVTLKQVDGGSNTANMTTPVTVTAVRIPVSDLEDILSLVKDSGLLGNKANTSVLGTSNTGPLSSLIGQTGGLLGGQTGSDPLSSIRPFQLLKDIQFGTGSIVAGDWQYPRTITMGLLDIGSLFGIEKNISGPASAHLITIFVVPYVGVTDLGSVPLH